MRAALARPRHAKATQTERPTEIRSEEELQERLQLMRDECDARNAAGGEGMTVEIECAAPDDTALAESFVRLLRERVGITMEVVLCPPGALAAKTGIESRQKPIRLKDER